jgi:hypothetical protein
MSWQFCITQPVTLASVWASIFSIAGLHYGKHRHYETGICRWLGTWHQLAYNRSYQRALNRVPTIGFKEQRHFDITYTFLADKFSGESALQQVRKIQNDRQPNCTNHPWWNYQKLALNGMDSAN